MAIACPVDFDTQMLRSEVSKVYSRVATDPDGDFHFHRGPAYAADFLGYDRDELAALPKECTASFAGIANPHIRLFRAKRFWISVVVPGRICCWLPAELALAA